jgi:signal transduction histidine kinase
MSDEGVKHLFVDFGKLKENESRNKQGTGLGLSICKQIIEKMGGSVEVKSELNVGTQFIINVKTKCQVKRTNTISKNRRSRSSSVFIFL